METFLHAVLYKRLNVFNDIQAVKAVKSEPVNPSDGLAGIVHK